MSLRVITASDGVTRVSVGVCNADGYRLSISCGKAPVAVEGVKLVTSSPSDVALDLRSTHFVALVLIYRYHQLAFSRYSY